MAKKRRGRWTWKKRAYLRVAKGRGQGSSLGAGLDEIGFRPLGRRIAVKTKRNADFPSKHPAPSDAYYDDASGRIVVEFENGSAFTVPARSLEGLVEASENDIAEVQVRGETGLHWESLDRDHEIALLMSGVFGTPSFMVEIATRAMELHEDVQTGEFSAWARPVDEFLSYNIPYDDLLGWEHYHMTAYEVGCEAMIALGGAQRTVGGAKPRRLPERPSTPPRWDDISTVVIYVAAQNEQLRFWPFDTPVRSWKASDGRSVANIAAANGAGPAYTTSEVYSVLEALGLVRAGRWTEVAETVLWRDNPMEWNLDFKSDARFIGAAFEAAANVPDDIRCQIDAIVESTDEKTRLERTPHVENTDAETVPPAESKGSRDMLEDSRRYNLDVLFFRQWRLSGGWLTDTEAKSALEVHHDALAISMRKAVMSWLYPSRPGLTL